MLLVPAIDLRGGRCVRLFQGDFAAETRYEHEPLDLLVQYRALGASWLHVVDLDGARDGTQGNRAVIAALAREPGIHIQVGGGIRAAATVTELLALGVARVVVGSTAVESPDEVARWFDRHGPEKVCLAFDVRLDGEGIPRVSTRGWRQATSVSLWEAVARFPAVRHVLCTDIARDGALTGPNLELYRQAVSRFPGIAWQASGGVSGAADLRQLALSGVAAAISGKALLEQRINTEELRPFLLDASSPASTSATAR